MKRAFGADDRGVMIPVAHVMTIAITTILITALLIGASGLLEDQRESATREELRTVGNRLSADIARVDALAQRGGSANATSRHTDEIAGSRYTVALRQGSCDTNRIDANTCLELSAVETDATQYVPVHNDSAVHLRSEGAGVFQFNATAEATTTNAATWDRLDLRSRIGIGRDVQPNGLNIGAVAGNQPPEANFRPRPGSPQANQPLEFDATSSRDPDGDIQQYEWWVDGNYVDDTTNPTIDHPLPAGTHNVTLRVEDNEGQTHNTTRFIDVSGLVYNQNLDLDGADDDVIFTVTNTFGRAVDLTHVSIDPADDSIDDIDNYGAPEVTIDASNDGALDDEISLTEGGRIRELTDDASLDAGSTATIRISGFEDDVKGTQLDLGLQYVYRDIPNATTFSDVPGQPGILGYELTASGTDVDLTFETTKQLDDVDIQIGGGVSKTIDESDLTETTSGGDYEYTADVSDGTNGFIWANMTTALSGGVQSGGVPVNDSVVTTSGSFTWASASDWDNATSAAGIVHTDYGDRSDDRLELGYSRSDQGGNNLVGFWPLDSTASDPPDESGTGNDGQIEGDPASRIGLFGTDSYALDGSDDHVRIPDSPSIEMASENEVTVSGWVNKDRPLGGKTAIFQHSDESYILQLVDDEPSFVIYDDGWHSTTADTQLRSNRWYHIVGVFDGNSIDLYVNGSLVSSDNHDVDIEPTNMDAGLGENIHKPGRHLDGKVDEVRLYDRALDATEVDRLYETHGSGSLTTSWKSGSSIDGDDVALLYDGNVHVGDTVQVRVHSRDGADETTSDWVTLDDGPGTVDVPGLNQNADEHRLEVDLTSDNPTHAPTVSAIQVVDDS